MKWELDQRDGTIGWVAPKQKGEEPQSRMRATVDIEDALSDPKVRAVLRTWESARLHEGPAFSGGVIDAWPALMVDGLALCRTEEHAIDDFVRSERAVARG